MTALTIVPAEVRPVRIYEWAADGPAGEALAAGEAIRIDGTTGKYTPGNGTAAGETEVIGISINTADFANATISVVKRGIVDVGEALAALDYGDPVYLSDTDGQLDTAAGTVGIQMGIVVPAWGATTADKLLDVAVVVLPVEAA